VLDFAEFHLPHAGPSADERERQVPSFALEAGLAA
jgi:hypothetical protein